MTTHEYTINEDGCETFCTSPCNVWSGHLGEFTLAHYPDWSRPFRVWMPRPLPPQSIEGE